MSPRILILRAPGTNCDEETRFAFSLVGGEAHCLHVNRLIEQPRIAEEYQILCIPGGFSFGDDLAAGRILARRLQQHLGDQVVRFRDAGKLILGICNGFQVLIKAGLLVAGENGGVPATLAWNDSGRFEDRWVHLAVSSAKCPFLSGVSRIYLPVAHAEGKFVARDHQVLDRLDEQGQLVLRYASAADGPTSCDAPLPYPQNPNGSLRNVAGVCDATGRVFGLMPHPERFVDPTQHPHWTRHPRASQGAGLQIFQNAVAYFR